MSVKGESGILFRMTSYALLGILIFYCKFIDAKDLYTDEVKTISTSDDIDLDIITFSYINNLRSHFWPYVEAADSDFDWGIVLHHYSGQASGTDFTATQLEGVLGWRYSDQSYFGLRAGGHYLEVPSQNDEKSRLTYEFDAQIGLFDNFNLQINAADDYVYQEGLQPAGAREFLNAQKRLAGFEWKPFERIRVTASSSMWELSDSNVRKQSKVGMFYGISPSWPWIWAGIAYEKLSYNEAKPDYWTPGIFHSRGIVFESSFPVTDKLAAAFSGSIYKIEENNFSEGDGDSVFAGLDYKLTDNHTLRFKMSRIHSRQAESDWSEDTYSLSLNGSF